MCRNIRTLFNFDPPATEEEIRAASVQFVRKLSGFSKPSQANEAAFDLAVDEVAAVARRLIDSLVTSGAPRTVEWARAAPPAPFTFSASPLRHVAKPFGLPRSGRLSSTFESYHQARRRFASSF